MNNNEASIVIAGLTDKQADMFISWFSEIGIGRDSFNDFLITNDVEKVEECNEEVKFDTSSISPMKHLIEYSK